MTHIHPYHIEVITPLLVEMLAGEDIPHLLQTLLVGVEHAICRVPLDELTFPLQYDGNNSNISDPIQSDESEQQQSTVCKLLLEQHNGSEINTKLRKLITKNNSINKKVNNNYAACNNKRLTSNGIFHDEKNGTLNSNADDSRAVTQALTHQKLSSKATLPVNSDDENNSLTSITGSVSLPSTSTLPLFCLGESFPHIDSDEESGDDSKKIQSGECMRILRFHISFMN